MAVRTKRGIRQIINTKTSKIKTEYQKQRRLGRERKLLRNQYQTRYKSVNQRKGKLHQKVHQRRAASAFQAGRLIPSSWIFGLTRQQDGRVIMDTPGQLYRSRMAIPMALYLDWRAGTASCITSDSGIIKRWWRGKTPSLGAYYNKHIRGKYQFDKL